MARTGGRAGAPVEQGDHPRTIGWFGTTALAMGGSNQSLFLLGALVAAQGTGAIPLLVVGLLLSWAALPGWTELILMWPKRVGGIAATCAEAFRPYSAVLANLTGVCYWWGWIPTCGLTAMLSASAIHHWYLPDVPVVPIAIAIVLTFTALNMLGVWWVARAASVIALGSAALAFVSVVAPIYAGDVDWHQATTFDLTTPFDGVFGTVTSAMAGLYLIGFAAPAFEAAACHVGETRDPARNVPRAMFASAALASVYFVALPVVWLGTLGAGPLELELATVLGPTFTPLAGGAAKAFAVWFMVLSMFHGTLQPLAGAARTISQLADDGLLPRILMRRTRRDVPVVATVLTAFMAIAFLFAGDPTWLIASANFSYLIGICLPSIAVWLLRRNEPGRARPYRAPRFAIGAGVAAVAVWTASVVLGFQQYGLPSVLVGLALAYAGAFLYAVRVFEDAHAERRRPLLRSIHVKLTGAMLAVIALDGVGYLLAVSSISDDRQALRVLLEDIFVGVALLTVTVGLVVPGVLAHAVSEVAAAAERFGRETVSELRRAMRSLADGDIDAASVRIDSVPIAIRSRDEVGSLAATFNTMQGDVGGIAVALDQAREGLRAAQAELRAKNAALARASAELEERVAERTRELSRARDELAALATTDPLTGTPNHRALVTAVDQQLARATRAGRACSVLFIDVDHFKQLNDTFGHAVGDQVLAEVAAVIRRTLRAGDTIGRWGGEEFLAILPDAPRDAALEIAERIRAAVAAHAFADGAVAAVTCSIGAATFPDDGEDRPALVDAADRAMYAAKRLGRNRVFDATDARVATAAAEPTDPETSSTVEALLLLVAGRDDYTAVHTRLVAQLAGEIAIDLGCDPGEVEAVRLAGWLHDVGKVAVPDAVLRKTEPLTVDDWTVLRGHPAVGAEAVQRIPGLARVAPLVRAHHERWDGGGYPDGAAGEAIPLGARIVAVADAYSAMTTDRVYRPRLGSAAAIAELRRCAGSQFDRAAVDACARVVASAADRRGPLLRTRTTGAELDAIPRAS